MNNDLKQFSEERLKELVAGDVCGKKYYSFDEVQTLARIALAAKQAKPTFEEWLSSRTGTIEVDCGCVTTEAFYHWLKVAYEETPHPAHTEQVITDNVRDALEKALNAMQFMGDTLNNLDAVCAEDVEHVTPAFEAIRKLLAAATKPEIE